MTVVVSVPHPVEPRLSADSTARASGTSIRNLPVSLFGSVMGLSGLALAWRLAGDSFGVGPLVAEAVAGVAVLMFLLLAAGYLGKLVFHRDAELAEFRHPISGNFFGTIAIAVLLLSAVVAPYHETLGQFVWIVGTGMTALLSGVIVSRVLSGSQDASHAIPAWLVPGVATLDIAVTGGTMPMAWAREVNLFAVAVGTVMALVFFAMIFTRLVHREPLPASMTPSLMILIAPFEVGFLAYTKMTGQIDMFAAMLFYFGLFLFAVLAIKVFRPSVPFSVGWWAISFPIAALSNAAFKYAAASGSNALTLTAGAILVFLSVALAVLLLRTLHLLLSGKLLAG